MSGSKLQLIQAAQAPKLAKYKGFIHSFMVEIVEKAWLRNCANFLIKLKTLFNIFLYLRIQIFL